MYTASGSGTASDDRARAHHITQCYTSAVLRVFKTKTFARWSRKAGVPDEALCTAVKEMADGLVDADLGRHVYKKRVAVPGRVKRGGARVILGTRLEERWFFLFGFQKNERATVDSRELAALQVLAEALLSLEAKPLEQAVRSGELLEICREEEPTTH